MGKFFTKKKIIIFIVILIIAAGIYYSVKGPKNNAENIVTETVKKQTLKQTVLATGQVTSVTDLSLSFKVSGVVASVPAKVGQKVAEGTVLANLQQKDQVAALTQARGQLAQAKANLQKVMAGASSEEVKVSEAQVKTAQVSLDNAKRNLDIVKNQQAVLVKNAYSSMLNSTLQALSNPTNISKPTVSVSGSYTGTEEGTYILTIYEAGGGRRVQVSGLENSDAGINANIPTSIGTRGLFVTFSSTNLFSGDSWSITIPNKQAVNYVSNQNAYQSSLETQKSAEESAQAAISNAQVALDQANANLTLKQAQARPADIESANAQILSAQGQVEAAQASLENTIIRAPTSGTITSVDIKPGELATALKQAVKLQDVGNLHVEANISEANIADLKTGLKVEMTFDAFGPDQKYMGTVQTIDPSSTVVSGVVNYKVISAIDKQENIKPGMTANIIILVNQKENILTVPQRAVLEEAGMKFVRVISNSQTKEFTKVPVTTGLIGDGGVVEILNGVNLNQEVVTLIKAE